MFQLWKLVLLCGLVSGTSAGLFQALGNGLGNIVDNLKPIIDNGLEDISSVLQDLRADVNTLQNTNVWQTVTGTLEQAKNVLNGALSKILSNRKQALGLKISNVHILNIKAEQASDDQDIRLTFPTSAHVSLTLPLVKKTVELNASLDLVAAVKIENDAQSGDSRVVMTECASDPNSISFTLLGEHSELVNKLTDAASSFLSNTVSFLVQSQMCPLMRIFISTVDAQFIENIIGKEQQGAQVQVAV